MKNSRFNFDLKDYESVRPSYPSSLFDWILSLGDFKYAADIGCGTGKASRLLSQRGVNVIGVEPSKSMRKNAVLVNGFRIINGTASATTLPDASVDLVISAESFHWFDIPKALVEINRILKPNGTSCAFWNKREYNDCFMRAYNDLLMDISSDYYNICSKKNTQDQIKEIVLDFQDARFINNQVVNFDEFILRARLWSNIVKIDVSNDKLEEELVKLYNIYNNNGNLLFKYNVNVVSWKKMEI